MKPITKQQLKDYEQSFKADRAFHVLRRALVKNSLEDISYIHEADAHTNFKFSIDLETLPPTNQQSTGRCWLFAGLNVLREAAAKKYNVKNIEFSQNYIAFFDKYEKINYFIEAIDDHLHVDGDDRTLKHLLSQGIQDGGQWDMFVSLVLKYGIVIKDAMPETNTSSNTRFLNRLINIQLRKYTAKARQLAKDNKLKEIKTLKEETLKNLYNLLSATLGIPPKTFNFEYVDNEKTYHLIKDIDPLKFYEDLDYNLADYVSIINAPTSDKPFNQSYTIKYLGNVIGGRDIRHLNVEMPRLVELVLSQLTDKEVVWFGCDVTFDNDRKRGIWNDSAYDFSTTFLMDFNMSKEDRLNYVQGQMNHAMVITGVNLDNKIPTKWKIENSWGEERGQKGYYLMTHSWFNEHTYQAVIHKKYLTKEEYNNYLKEPTLLKPWDPMGSLAK